MDMITQIGCIVCYILGHPGTPGVPHHMLDEGGRRIGHTSTICLCDPGHHQNGGKLKISRHPNKARFEQAYGTEESLLDKTRQLLDAQRTKGVDIDRIHHKLGAVKKARAA